MKYAIIGRKGLIGSALAKKLGEVGSFPTPDTKVLFHFGSVVHPPFEENPDYHINEILTSFLYLLPYCRDNDIYFVYPSSALVYEKTTQFATTKKIMELMASMYPKTLGLRIFPVYGPGETRTVISQWCAQMKAGQRPIVYGDGTQERDFIYIDDVVDQILELVENKVEGVRDIGAGKPVSFNSIIDTINKLLGKNLKPLYKDKPFNYSQGIVCQNPMKTKFSIEYGCKNILEPQIWWWTTKRR